MPRWLQVEESPAFRRRCASSARCSHARSAEEASLHPQWLGHYLSAVLKAISQHCISGALQRHRITDAGMQLDRARGGAASGEGERLPGRLYSFPPVGGNEVPFFHERKREVTVIQKAVADNQLHGRKQQEQRKHYGCGEREKQIKDMA